MNSEMGDPEWATRHLVLEVPAPASRLVAGHDVNVTVWLRNVGDRPIKVRTARELSATISRGPDVVAGPSGMRDSARILDLAPGATSEYGLWLNSFTTMNTPSSGRQLPPGTYSYSGTLSCWLLHDRRPDGGWPDGPQIVLATGPWPLTITDG